MTATTIYLPARLHRALRLAALRRGESATAIARRALERELRRGRREKARTK